MATAAGCDVRRLNRFATPSHFPVRLTTWPHRILSQPTKLLRFDLATDSLDDGRRHVGFTPVANGTTHGVVAWFELDLGNGVILRNEPQIENTDWMQAFIPWQHFRGNLDNWDPALVDRVAQGRTVVL